METILVPTDFSKTAENALLAATEIARRTKSEIILLHVVEAENDEPFSAFGGIRQANNMENIFILKSIEKAKLSIKNIADDVRVVGVRIHPKILVGDLEKCIFDLVKNEDVDLIVSGTNGSQDFFKGIFSDTNTEKMAMGANCMVLAIKNKTKNFGIRNVLLATNFEDDAAVFIKKIKGLQKVFEFNLHILYVNALLGERLSENDIIKKKNDFVRRHDIKEYEFKIIKNFTEYSGIAEYAKQIQADIIALSNHQHKGLHWLGGVSEDLINLSERPILTYKADRH